MSARIVAWSSTALVAFGCSRSHSSSALPITSVTESAESRANGPPAPIAAKAPVDGEIGTAHPLTLSKVAPDGTWVVVCQARADTDKDGKIGVDVGYHGDVYGDEMKSYFIAGTGPGVEIDDYVDSAADGSRVVVVKNKRLVLIDVDTGLETDLSARGADAEDDPSPFGGHRAAHFDGDRLLYLVKGSSAEAVVLDFGSGEEKRVKGGAGNLWRASIEGGWAILQVIAQDTNHDGKLGWPTVRTSLGGRRCRGPVSSYSVGGATGDEPVTRVVPLLGGAVRQVDDLVDAFGNRLLRRVATGALVVEEIDGKSRELVPAACKARVIEADSKQDRVLVACSTQKPAPLEIWSEQGKKDVGLAIELDPHGGDHWSRTPGRFVLVPGKDIVVDLDRGTARRFPDSVDAVFRDRILFRRDKRLFISRYGEKSEHPLAGETNGDPRVFVQGRYAYVEPLLVDLEAERVVGKAGTTARALSSNGFVLVGPESTEKPWWIPNGPLHWERPVTAR